MKTPLLRSTGLFVALIIFVIRLLFLNFSNTTIFTLGVILLPSMEIMEELKSYLFARLSFASGTLNSTSYALNNFDPDNYLTNIGTFDYTV